MSNQTSDPVLDELAALLHERIGLRPEPTLRSRLRRCIRDEAAARQQTPRAYLATVLAQPNVAQQLVDRVTVQETAFFRHCEQFEVLARNVLPHTARPVRIWSAACANGQEAYSLAMVLVEQGVAGSVIATDLSTTALERTAAATYSDREISGLSAERLARHMTRSDGGWRVNDAVRKRVSFAPHNLMHPLPAAVCRAQVVFCRNVLIYFAPDHTRTFLDRLADTLPEDLYLFLGTAETTWAVSDRFAAVKIDNTFVYRRRSQLVPAPGPTAPALTPAAAPTPVPPRARQRLAAVPSPARVARRPQPAAPTGPAGDDVHHLIANGQRALHEGDFARAVVEFRKWAYLAPDDAVAHLHLGLALDAAGDPASAARAFGAARRLATGADPTLLEQAIEGYSVADLLRMLDHKVNSPRGGERA